MRTHHRLPSVHLSSAELFFFRRLPTDRGRVNQNFCALHRRQPRRFGKPLVPANTHAYVTNRRLKALKTQIARREVKLLVEIRVVGDVHFSVGTQNRTVGLDHDRRIMKHASSAAFKYASDNHDFLLFSDLANSIGRWARDLFGDFKLGMVFSLAKIARTEKFLQANQVCPRLSRRFDLLNRGFNIIGNVARTGLLNRGDRDVFIFVHKCGF